MTQTFVNDILRQYDALDDHTIGKSSLTPTGTRQRTLRSSSSIQTRTRQKVTSVPTLTRSTSRNIPSGRSASRPLGSSTAPTQPLAPFTPMSFTTSYKSMHPHLYAQSDLPKISFKQRYDLEIVTKRYEEVASHLNEIKQTILTLKAREDVAKNELSAIRTTVETRAAEIADLLCNLREILPNVVTQDVYAHINNIDVYIGELCSEIAINRMAGKSQFLLYSKTNSIIQSGPSDNMRQRLYRGINYYNRQADKVIEQTIEVQSIIAHHEDTMRRIKKHLDPVIAEVEFLEAEVEEKTHMDSMLLAEEEKERELESELKRLKQALLDTKTQISSRLTEKEHGKMALPDYLNDSKVIGYAGERLSAISSSMEADDMICHPSIKMSFLRLYNYILSLEHLQSKHGIRAIHTSSTSTKSLFDTFEKHRVASNQLNKRNQERYDEHRSPPQVKQSSQFYGSHGFRLPRSGTENDVGLPVYETITLQQRKQGNNQDDSLCK